MGYGIQAFGIHTALGANVEETASRLFSEELPPLINYPLCGKEGDVPAFQIVGPLPPLPTELKEYECRNNRIAQSIYRQIETSVKESVERFSPSRIGVVVGSSTSGIDASEKAVEFYRHHGKHPDHFRYNTQHAMGSLSDFVARLAGTTGPSYTISTACSSSSKAMISAKGLLDLGVCDGVITGGVDTLCDLTINGFSSLSSLGAARMNPMSANRDGLNIGEGGALFLLTRNDGLVSLLGGGESMDAYHMSAPHPDGIGAKAAMHQALHNSGIDVGQIEYVNLHGTATSANDSMESIAVHEMFDNVKCSSTKPFVGHCLGAAGAVEAGFCYLSLTDELRRLPPHVWDSVEDETIPRLNLADSSDRYLKNDTCFLSNSFAFGGNNCALVFKRHGGRFE